MQYYRQSCELGAFIEAYKNVQPTISAVKLTAFFLSDTFTHEIKNRAMALFHMKRGWHKLMGITL